MSIAEKLLASAALRRQQVDVDGEKVTIREPNAFEYAQYQEQLGVDKTAAIAHLLRTCVLGEDGESLFSEEQARAVATGSFRVSAVLVTSIHRLIHGAVLKNA